MESIIKTGKLETLKKLRRSSSLTYFELEPTSLTKEESFEEIKKDLSKLSLGEKINIILSTIGYDSRKLDVTSQLTLICRLLPLVEPSLVLYDIGTSGSGKSFFHSRISDKSLLITSSITEANLCGNANKKDDYGLLGQELDSACIEELTTLTGVKQPMFGLFREIFNTGKISRTHEQTSRHIETSFVLTFNLEGDLAALESDYTNLESLNIYKNIDKAFSEKAFLDRISGAIPSWFLQTQDVFVEDENVVGYVVGDFCNYMKTQREKEIDLKYVTSEKLCGRRLGNVTKLIYGFIKLLFPNEDYTKDEFYFMESLALWLDSLKNNKDYDFISTSSNKRIILEIIKPFLRNEPIKRAWIDRDYLMVKYSDNLDNIYCYPLNCYAVRNSEKLFLEYSNLSPQKKKYVVPIKKDCNNTIIREYCEPINNKNEIRMVDLKSFSELKKIYTTPFQRDILEVLSNMDKKISNCESSIKTFKKDTITTYRELRLDIKKILLNLRSCEKISINAPFLIDSSILEDIRFKKAIESFKIAFSLSNKDLDFSNLSFDRENPSIKIIDFSLFNKES